MKQLFIDYVNLHFEVADELNKDINLAQNLLIASVLMLVFLVVYVILVTLSLMVMEGLLSPLIDTHDGLLRLVSAVFSVIVSFAIIPVMSFSGIVMFKNHLEKE